MANGTVDFHRRSTSFRDVFGGLNFLDVATVKDQLRSTKNFLHLALTSKSGNEYHSLPDARGVSSVG